MKTGNKLAGMLSVLVLVAVGALMLSRNVSAAGEGKITGTVKLAGTAPHQKPIDMSKEPYCQKLHADHPVTLESVVAGSNGGLQNVVVYISEGLPASAASQVPSEKPKWDQKGCQYIPHVVALDVNQHFLVTNSDPTSHNIHPIPTKNPQWNKSQPPGAQPFDVLWANEEVSIQVKCNIHPWMQGWMAVVRGPTAVSDANGFFTLDNVPLGAYTLTAWQETYGIQTQKVTVAAGKPATADFTFKAK